VVGQAGSESAVAASFLAVVVAQLRRELAGPWPGDPPGAVVLTRLVAVPCDDPDAVVLGLDLLVHGIVVQDSFAIPGWSKLAVGSPTALGRALAAEIRLHIQHGVIGARVESAPKGRR
jgi:hypothetical protein